MKRRAFLSMMSVGSAAISFGGSALGVAPARKKPNVLFIAIDDLNDWVGCLGGHPDAKTPNIDRLAQRGVLFTNAHCAAASCNPSRASLLTGIAPWSSGVYNNSHNWQAAMPDAVTLPRMFKDHGYYTAGAGKIFHGAMNDKLAWHEYLNRPDEPGPPDDYPRNVLDWAPIDAKDEEMADGQVAGWIIERIKRQHDKPFFLAPGFWKPHLPWYVPQEYFDMYPVENITLPEVKDDDLSDVPPIGRGFAGSPLPHRTVVESGQWREAVQAYLACVSFVDAQVGRVIEALDKSPYSKDTVIVLWSDHGWHLGEKLHWHKFTLWEEATRNPMVFVVPGVTRPDLICTRPASLLDIYPTLGELSGLKTPGELDGESLVPLLKNPKASREKPALTAKGRGNLSVRDERWRLTRYSDGTEELYDHEKDAGEWTNLAGLPEYANVEASLARWMPNNWAPDAPGKRSGDKKKNQ
jgi:arylsulfatase A-like enzyme